MIFEFKDGSREGPKFWPNDRRQNYLQAVITANW